MAQGCKVEGSTLIGGSFFFFLKPSQNLDPSYKMDLVFWDSLGRLKLVIWQNFIGLILVICCDSREGKT